jgi:hypothetical protein
MVLSEPGAFLGLSISISGIVKRGRFLQVGCGLRRVLVAAGVALRNSTTLSAIAG